MNNKKIIQLIVCLVLVAPVLCTLLFAGNEPGTNTEAEQHFQRANELHISADYDAAITEYEAVIQLSPNSKIAQNAQYWIGQLYFEIKQFDAALSGFQKLLDEYPTSTIIPSTKTMIERVQQAKKNRALFEAVKEGDIEQVKQIIAEGADIDAMWGDTAAKEEQENVRARDLDDTPLFRAADANNIELVKFLVEAGADVNAGGFPPLPQAIYRGNMAIAKYLIDHGANANYPEDWGPIHETITTGSDTDIEILELLIEKGADINGGSGWLPVHLALNWEKEDVNDIVEFLIQHGADVNAKDGYGFTPLFYAYNLDLMNLLIANGADVNGESHGESVLIDSARIGDREAVQCLLEAGADINAKDDIGQTALHLAAQNGHTDVAELLIDEGADINAKDNDAHTPLYIAVNNDYKVAELLINKGADSAIKTESGQTLGQLAKQRKQLESAVPDMILDGVPNSSFGLNIVCSDVDRDGYDDIIVSAHQYSNLRGRVYLFYGGSDMDTTADLIFEGQNEGDLFGNSVCCGDIDNDGYADIIIGAYSYSTGQGRAYLYWGSNRTSMDTNPDKIFSGEQEKDSRFGMGSPTVYDIDNDGYDDIILGAPRSSNGTGKAYLYYGNTKELMDTSIDLIFTGENQMGVFGLTTSCGDVDGDNYGDIVIGAQSSSGGKVYLYYGSSKASMDAKADVVFEEESEDSNYFGSSIVCVDQNRDGYDDVVIGARGSSDVLGRAYLFYGNTKRSLDTYPDMIFEGDVGSSRYGNSAVYGDIDGDNVIDLFIGDRGVGQRVGRVYVYWGNELTGPDPKPDRILTGEGLDRSPIGLACGDVNNDGFDDLVVGAIGYKALEGRAYLYYGGPRKK